MGEELKATYVVVGGGITGVSCVETLAIIDPQLSVILVTASSLIKQVTNVMFFAKTITKFDVNETEANTLQKIHPNLNIIYDSLTYINSEEKYIKTGKNVKIIYKHLCICTGGIPKMIANPSKSDRIIGIRDTDSVANFFEKIKNSKTMVVIGNGGIASEIIYNTKGINKVWIIKDNYISSTFIDPGAAEFFKTAVNSKKDDKKHKTVIKRHRFAEENSLVSSKTDDNIKAAALGPDWINSFADKLNNEGDDALKIMYNCEIEQIVINENQEWPLTVKLKNGNVIDCDLVVSAIGVEPAINFQCDREFILGKDGGILVDDYFKTNIENIFAAGDICTAGWETSKHWFQMRLWTQARQMGSNAAKSMYSIESNELIYTDFCFELFTHCTTLYGYQVILLGAYNGQNLDKNYEIMLRTTPNLEYIKFIIQDGRLQGAILIGETDLEEMAENLILNQIDLTPFGTDLLDPNIDIDDYFD